MERKRLDATRGETSRRRFLLQAGAFASASLVGSRALVAQEKKDDKARDASGRRFTIDLVPGRIGIRCDQARAIELAAANGFESVAPSWADLARLDDDGKKRLEEDLKERKLVFGAADLPVNFRDEEGRFRKDMLELPDFVKTLDRFGIKRVGTWIRPSEQSRTYIENFHTHARRLREVAKALGEKGIRLGLEYVGPKRSWAHYLHPFIHTMVEMSELIDEIGEKNVGFVLDSWHWYHAHEGAEHIRELRADAIVAVDLNDAPAGIERDDMVDHTRELPAATGVIDLKSFLSALVRIGYDGPVRAEPFSQALNELPAEEAAAQTAQAMKQAIALILPAETAKDG
ncbi:MAG TPA: sugar phosphate isomerase/epimerase family protein [Planctomycetota bacterium]|nr:sugar phosphate isomerase/epimerase family protein [Planctomycetota bacterium]